MRAKPSRANDSSRKSIRCPTPRCARQREKNAKSQATKWTGAIESGESEGPIQTGTPGHLPAQRDAEPEAAPPAETVEPSGRAAPIPQGRQMGAVATSEIVELDDGRLRRSVRLREKLRSSVITETKDPPNIAKCPHVTVLGGGRFVADEDPQRASILP